MTFLRRGNVAFPHRLSAGITLHRITGIAFDVKLKDISCYEEFQPDLFERKVIIYFTNGSNVVVKESFDAVAAACDTLEVKNV